MLSSPTVVEHVRVPLFDLYVLLSVFIICTNEKLPVPGCVPWAVNVIPAVPVVAPEHPGTGPLTLP
jgi:hypothetical protein